MNKIAFLPLLAFCLPSLSLTQNDAEIPAAPETTPSAPASDKEQAREQARAFLRQQRDARRVFSQLCKRLRSVSDRETADAAAPEISKLTTSFIEQMAQLDAMGEPDPKVAALIQAWVEKNPKEVEPLEEADIVPLFDLMLKSPSCHGSEALTHELERLIDALAPHDAEVEDVSIQGCEGDDEDPSAGEADEDMAEDEEDAPADEEEYSEDEELSGEEESPAGEDDPTDEQV